MNVIYKPDAQTKAMSYVIINDIHLMQQLVHGKIETHDIGEGVVMICNEDGKLIDMDYTLTDPDYGIIVGPILFVGEKEDDFCSLSAFQADYIKLRYRRQL